MHTIPDNATRVQRFRELKATLRTRRDRLLVGIDIAKAQHVAQIRLAHTRILDAKVTIPNTQAGFGAFWTRLVAHQATTRAPEIVCAVDRRGPTTRPSPRSSRRRGRRSSSSTTTWPN